MNNRTELENQLIQEIHTLPLEMIQAMLQLALSVKKVTQHNTVQTALHTFLKKYENKTLEIDTTIFEDYRKTTTDLT